MNERPTRMVRQGGRLSASELNRAFSRLDDLSDFSGQGIGSSNETGSVLLHSTLPPKTHVRILVGGTGPLAWEEVYLDTDGVTWLPTGARSGTTTVTPAIERNAATVTAGSVYEATFDAGPDGTGRWLFNVGGGVSLVRVTSTTKTSGRYPGKIVTYDAAGATWTDGATIWIVDPNGNDLGLKYGEATYVGAVSGVPVYMGSANLWDDGTCDA